MSSSFWLLGFESRDFPQAVKEKTACKAEQIHKKRQPWSILSENSCCFFNFFSFASSYFFFSMRKITWINSQHPKTRGHVEHHTPLWLPECKSEFLEYLGCITLVQPYDVDALPRLEPNVRWTFCKQPFFPSQKSGDTCACIWQQVIFR